jgi:hypothetical protein
VILLIGHTAPIVDDAIEHEHGFALRIIGPAGRLDMLEVRGRDVELPEIVAVAGLETHRGGLVAREPHVIIAPTLEVTVGRRFG